VTVCVPGSNSCQAIDGVLVDTGSSGLRLLSSVLSVALPQQTDASGHPIAVCGQFQDGYTWGPVQSADIKIAGEVASAVPIQVIGAPAFSTVPAGCSSTGLMAEDTLDVLQANGVLGVGPFRQDCGVACSLSGSSNPGFYFSCSGSACTPTTESLTRQLQNPVWLFPTDNNGVVIQLPSVPALGAMTASGSLTFGIGTQGDNTLGTATILTTNLDGTITTIFNGQSYGQSVIDSGSNGYYFLDSATTLLPICTDNKSFYCPATAQTLNATNRGANNVSSTVALSVVSIDTLPAIFTAFNDVGGPNPGSFDFGLPFFFGRKVFTAIEGQSTPGGVGPYFAY
jgi:hypothetical protein